MPDVFTTPQLHTLKLFLPIETEIEEFSNIFFSISYFHNLFSYFHRTFSSLYRNYYKEIDKIKNQTIYKKLIIIGN